MNRTIVPVAELREVFTRVMDEWGYDEEFRKVAWAAAVDNNAKAYGCYRAILNSWGVK